MLRLFIQALKCIMFSGTPCIYVYDKNTHSKNKDERRTVGGASGQRTCRALLIILVRNQTVEMIKQYIIEHMQIVKTTETKKL